MTIVNFHELVIKMIKCARFVFGYPFYESVSSLRNACVDCLILGYLFSVIRSRAYVFSKQWIRKQPCVRKNSSIFLRLMKFVAKKTEVKL